MNVTPDSFSDGGRYFSVQSAVEHGLALLEQGADMLDVGAESTRPHALPLSAVEEQERLLPVLTALRQRSADAFLSVDTYKARTAARSLEAGADVINDVSACSEPALLDVLVQYKPGYVLMHNTGRAEAGRIVEKYPLPPGDNAVADQVLAFFERQLNRFVQAGLGEEHIVLDPGIGFGKNGFEGMALLRACERLQTLGRPVYMGLSMKSLFGEVLSIPLEQRREITTVATALLAARNIRYHRVHHVAEAARALRLVEKITPGL